MTRSRFVQLEGNTDIDIVTIVARVSILARENCTVEDMVVAGEAMGVTAKSAMNHLSIASAITPNAR